MVDMFPNFLQHLNVLNSLDLDPSKYLITGGGVLAVHGIRDCADLDIVCIDALGNELRSRFLEVPVTRLPYCDSLFINGIEFSFNFEEKDRPYSTELQIKEADIFDGKRYQTLKTLKFFKRIQNRPKDMQDIVLIETYESKL